jgi:transcriptional regulator with XRE-family HTH domain
MQSRFGEALKAARHEKDLTLREFASRAGLHAGNVSKIERGRMAPPQDPAVLDRMIGALDYRPADERAQELKDLAALANGRIPQDLLDDEEVLLRMPVLLRTLKGRRLTTPQVEELVEMIRKA